MPDNRRDASHLRPCSIKSSPPRTFGSRCASRVARLSLALALAASFASGAAAQTGWKLITAVGLDGSGAPALMQVAGFDRSDSGIGGLMFRCGDHQIETILVLIDPLPPRTAATLTLLAGRDAATFEASTIPTGAGLRIAFDPSTKLASAWKGATDLYVSAGAAGIVSKAVFTLDGLDAAVENLRTQCSSGGRP